MEVTGLQIRIAGQTTFNTAGLSSGWVSAESKIRQMSTSDATSYTFNAISKTGGSTTPSYDGLNTWDVTTNITAGQDSTLAYAKTTGTSYKTTFATLKVKYVAQVGAPVANFSAVPTSGNEPLTVQFTDASTGTVSSYAWDFDNDGTVDSTTAEPLAYLQCKRYIHCQPYSNWAWRKRFGGKG